MNCGISRILGCPGRQFRSKETTTDAETVDWPVAIEDRMDATGMGLSSPAKEL